MVVFKKLKTKLVNARRTTTDKDQLFIATGHLSNSGDLNIYIFVKPRTSILRVNLFDGGYKIGANIRR